MEKTENSKKTGMIHIYCGDGKGKTTAGMGLCVRAAGYGYRVLIDQYMKDANGSERKILAQVPGITLLPAPDRVKFSFLMNEEEKEKAREMYRQKLDRAAELTADGEYDVLFLDEILYAVNTGLIGEEDLIAFLKQKNAALEVILTGREPGKALLDMADYVSEIRKVKHPYDHGLAARPGIEK